MGLFFNLSDDEREFAQPKVVYCLVIYDIVSSKRRLKLSHLLESFGTRVQKSCFEIKISKASYTKLLTLLDDYYQEREGDRIRVYKVRENERILFDTDHHANERARQIFL
ncbi:CRISPR-associated endonuclease Cas2 [Streptococcus tangpeifui]|uniref:CRISPR-associated endonuclease Cas2 n=1 Tax=Streptococcus tangpeifui TaxID=2709400 RepID=UPI0013EB8771|nr:CRISPR-associated endonuclease Cas2 [Streptococcus sp. ZJ1593]